MADDKPIGIDATGYEVLTKAILDLLSAYPGLDGKEILFEELNSTSGIAFSADNGALVMTERRTVTGKIWQTCQYPFFVIYRIASTQERQKLQAQTFLDSLGKWICQEPAKIDGTYMQLKSYPDLSQGRKITRITRLNSYGSEPDAQGIQDWILPVIVQYTNEIQPIKKGE